MKKLYIAEWERAFSNWWATIEAMPGADIPSSAETFQVGWNAGFVYATSTRPASTPQPRGSTATLHLRWWRVPASPAEQKILQRMMINDDGSVYWENIPTIEDNACEPLNPQRKPVLHVAQRCPHCGTLPVYEANIQQWGWYECPQCGLRSSRSASAALALTRWNSLALTS